MKITNEEKKIKGIELLNKLGIYKPYIKGFEKNNDVCYFENFAGFWAYQEPELIDKIKEIEKKYDCIVYAITHEYTEFGELYDFLLVTDYKREWNNLVYSQGNTFYTFAYVWNKDDNWCSELGTIGVQSFGGGIKRIA